MNDALRPLYVDVTDLIVLDLRTGIQRVVREMLTHGQAGAAHLSIVPVVAVGNRFHRVNEAGLRRMHAPGRGATEKRITHERGVSPLIQLAKRAARISPRFYNVLQRLYIRRQISRPAHAFYEARSVPIREADTLVLLDSFWGGSSTLAAAAASKRRGARVVTVVYDLIPVSHPQFCDATLVQKFGQLMAQAMAISDQVLAISQFSADSVMQAFPGKQATAFPLGHDLRESGGVQIRWPDRLWNGGQVFVIVGSVEPRKGHQTVLDAFERRWLRGADDKLLIIGKVGWHVEALIARIESHSEAGTRLFHIHNASDAMLADALRRADCGIIASYVEGFGLPLVEGLAVGLPMIAADIPVFREIAAEAVIYFAAGDAASLDAAVDSFSSQQDALREKAAAFVWPNWREAAHLFYGQIESQISETSVRSF